MRSVWHSDYGVCELVCLCDSPSPPPSPRTQLDLVDGKHTLTVQAIDSLGLVEASPLQKAFVVDTVPPVATAVILSKSPSRDAVLKVQLSCSGMLGLEVQPSA